MDVVFLVILVILYVEYYRVFYVFLSLSPFSSYIFNLFLARSKTFLSLKNWQVLKPNTSSPGGFKKKGLE